VNPPPEVPADDGVSLEEKPPQSRLLFLFLCFLLVFGVFVILISNNLLQINLTQRSDSPVSSQQATVLLAFVLPPGANDIYYLHHRVGMFQLNFYLRFHVPPDDAFAAMNFLVANRALQTNTNEIPIPGAAIINGPAPWWKVADIKHGFAILAPGSFSRSLWYDSDASVIYLHETN
jgi:hypothetical protein